MITTKCIACGKLIQCPPDILWKKCCNCERVNLVDPLIAVKSEFGIKVNFKGSTKALLEGNESWLNLGMIRKFIFRPILDRLNFLKKEIMSEIETATADVLDAVSKLNLVDQKLDVIQAKVDELIVGQLEVHQLEALKNAVAELKQVSSSVAQEATEVAEGVTASE